MREIYERNLCLLLSCGGGNIAFFLLCWMNRENSVSFSDFGLVAKTDGACCVSSSL